MFWLISGSIRDFSIDYLHRTSQNTFKFDSKKARQSKTNDAETIKQAYASQKLDTKTIY